MDNQQGLLNKRERGGNAVPFYALVFFTFLVYITPQAYFPALQPIRLALLCAIIAVASYIFNVLLGKQSLLELNKETFLVLVILSLAIISIPFSIWPGGSFGVLKDLYLKVIIIFLLISNVVTSTKRLKLMLWSIICFCTFLSIIAIKDFISGTFWQLDRIKGAGWSIAANPNDLALTIVLSIPFAASFYLLYKSILKKLILTAYIMIATYAVICTFSRGGFIGLATIYTVIFLKNIKKGGAKFILPVFILLIIIISFTPGGYKDRIFSIFDFSLDKTGSVMSRKASTIHGINIMLENPLLGVGLGMNILALNERGHYWDRIHNVYLEIGSEIGIPALFVFILLIIVMLRNMCKVQKESLRSPAMGDIALLAQAVEISLVGFAVAALFYPVAYNFYFYYIGGLAVATSRVAQAQKEMAY